MQAAIALDAARVQHPHQPPLVRESNNVDYLLCLACVIAFDEWVSNNSQRICLTLHET